MGRHSALCVAWMDPDSVGDKRDMLVEDVVCMVYKGRSWLVYQYQKIYIFCFWAGKHKNKKKGNVWGVII